MPDPEPPEELPDEPDPDEEPEPADEPEPDDDEGVLAGAGELAGVDDVPESDLAAAVAGALSVLVLPTSELLLVSRLSLR